MIFLAPQAFSLLTMLTNHSILRVRQIWDMIWSTSRVDHECQYAIIEVFVTNQSLWISEIKEQRCLFYGKSVKLYYLSLRIWSIQVELISFSEANQSFLFIPNPYSVLGTQSDSECETQVHLDLPTNFFQNVWSGSNELHCWYYV